MVKKFIVAKWGIWRNGEAWLNKKPPLATGLNHKLLLKRYPKGWLGIIEVENDIIE